MSNRGFTFLEILAAIAIMTIALIPIMRYTPAAIAAARKIERQNQSVFLAQDKIDEARSRMLGSNPDYGFDHDYTTGATAFSSPFTGYKYTISDNYAEDIKILNVTVWFDEDQDNVLDSGEPNVSLDTKIADRGF